MKGTDVVGRLSKCLLSFVAALATVGMMVVSFGATPALADSNPTLTLRLLRSPQGKPGQSVVLPGKMSSAGAGFVFRAVELDGVKVNNLVKSYVGAPADLQKKLNEVVSADLAAYRDSSGVEYHGASDAGGIITNRPESAGKGVWLQGAALNVEDGTLSGGTPAAFTGSASAPTYWYVSLVAGPKGVSVRTDSCVLQLPTLGGPNGSDVFDVNIYPKLAITRPADPPQKAKQAGILAKTGAPVMLPVLCAFALLVSGVALALRNRNPMKMER